MALDFVIPWGIQSIPASGGTDEPHGTGAAVSPFILRRLGQVCCVPSSFGVQHQVRWKSSFPAGITSGEMVLLGMRIPPSSIRTEMPPNDPIPGHSWAHIRAWRHKGTENQAREQGCVCRVLFMSSENSSPVLKQHRNAANAQTGARELPGRLILATNPGELQKLPVNSNPETFQNTFFPEESRGAACIFSNIHQRTGPSHTFKSRPRKYGKAEIILGSNPGTCHSACKTSYE